MPALLVFIALGFGVPIAFQVVINQYVTVMLALGLVGAAYMAETIRAGIRAVPKGQVEAARSDRLTHEGPEQSRPSAPAPIRHSSASPASGPRREAIAIGGLGGVRKKSAQNGSHFDVLPHVPAYDSDLRAPTRGTHEHL